MGTVWSLHPMKTWAVPHSQPTLLVSDCGDVIRMASSRRKTLKTWQTFPEKQLSPSKIGAGYLAVYVKNQGQRKTLYLHRLVAEAFLSKPFDCNEVNHIDGDKTNNHVLNLEWTTHSANLKHACQSGLHTKPMLCPDQVLTIKSLIAKNKSTRTIAKMFGISASAIQHIKHGRSWGWL